MSKRNLLNLILFTFILILVVLVVFEPGKEKPITPPTLTNLKKDDIHHIKINRRQGEPNDQNIVFEKSTDGWMMLEPYHLRANIFRIDSILKLLSTVSFSQNNLENLDKSKFDLIIPHATITFNNKTSIVFGNNKSLKHHRYVKIDSTLHMIADTFYYQLLAKTESYIDHKLLPENNKIIKLILPGMKIEQVKGEWQAIPKADGFTADSVNQLISEWQLSQAYDIKKVKIKKNTKADIIIQLANKTLHFKVGNTKSDFTLTNIDTGIQYILAKDRKDKLLNLVNPDQTD